MATDLCGVCLGSELLLKDPCPLCCELDEVGIALDSSILPALLEECGRFDLPGLKDWWLQGHSKAGERTGFWLHPLKVVLDAGMVTERAPVAVFISHSHVDHSWNLPWILGCRTPPLKGYESLRGRPVLAPSSAWPMLTQLEQTCHNLSVGNMTEDGMEREEILAEQMVHPMLVTAGEKSVRVPGLQGWLVEILPCYHPAESVGFGFRNVKQKIKPEYRDLDKKTKQEVVKQGISLTEEVEEFYLAFFGDTHIGALQDHVEWTKYPIIVIECTHYPETGKLPESVRSMGHIHWEDLLPIIVSHPENFFVVIHSSQAMRSKALFKVEQDVKKSGMATNFKIWYEP